jgi:hypothetical protein
MTLLRHKGSASVKTLPRVEAKEPRVDELEYGRREIKALGLEEYCSVLQF